MNAWLIGYVVWALIFMAWFVYELAIERRVITFGDVYLSILLIALSPALSPVLLFTCISDWFSFDKVIWERKK